MKQWLQKQLQSKHANRFLFGSFLSAAAVTIMAIPAWSWYTAPSQIVIQGMGTDMVITTNRRFLGEALNEQGIQLGPKDLVAPALSTQLRRKESLVVEVTRAVPVTLVVDGKPTEVLTTASTVGELLKELSLELGEKDRVSVDLSTLVSHNIEVRVIRRTEQIQLSQVDIPFDTVRREDQALSLGETKEIQPGEPGVKEITQVVFLEDGQVVGSAVQQEAIIKAPVERVIAYGTTGVVYRGGRNYRYTQELEMTATGYTAGKESNPNGNGYTYTGMKAVRGVVAVDPRVIPLYTRLYIEGYGPAIAADIGGAIKGNKIDLCFDTVAEALEWGRRPVKVFILGD